MKVKLKVVQGKLKGQDGGSAKLEVTISKARFVIGADSDCHMRCPSRVISPHHCEITVRDEEVRLRDLDSESGTFLNDERIAAERVVHAGDRLRVGRLEFEVVIERSGRTTKGDPVDDFVSDLLAQADEEERAVRRSDPELRQFHLDPNETNDAEQVEPEKEDKLTALRKKLPQKKPPGKLPPPLAITAESSTSAAAETLKKIFEKPKPKRPDY
ncbi:MAG: FHA domain-containing protein [Planctomycetota bacterium]|nr:FHA domain-containing protein [Planctomycetota bacterium]